MKKRTIIIILVFAWMLVYGLPVPAQSLQGQFVVESRPDLAIGAQLKPYSPYPFQQQTEIRTSGLNYTRKAGYGRTRGGNISRGFGIGLGIGAVGGGLIGAVSWTECTDEGFLACMMHPESRGQAFLVGAVLGGVAGGFTGIVAGAFSKTAKKSGRTVDIQFGVMPDATRSFALNPSLSVNLSIKKKK